MKITGQIVEFEERQTGTSKAGKEWVKQTFVVDTGQDYNNIIAFEVFGKEKVDNLNKYNKMYDSVSVEFNIQCNEWKGRYFTVLQAWRIDKANSSDSQKDQVFHEGGTDGLLF